MDNKIQKWVERILKALATHPRQIQESFLMKLRELGRKQPAIREIYIGVGQTAQQFGSPLFAAIRAVESRLYSHAPDYNFASSNQLYWSYGNYYDKDQTGRK